MDCNSNNRIYKQITMKTMYSGNKIAECVLIAINILV